MYEYTMEIKITKNIYKGGIYVLEKGMNVEVKLVGETAFYKHNGDTVLVPKDSYEVVRRGRKNGN